MRSVFAVTFVLLTISANCRAQTGGSEIAEFKREREICRKFVSLSSAKKIKKLGDSAKAKEAVRQCRTLLDFDLQAYLKNQRPQKRAATATDSWHDVYVRSQEYHEDRTGEAVYRDSFGGYYTKTQMGGNTYYFPANSPVDNFGQAPTR